MSVKINSISCIDVFGNSTPFYRGTAAERVTLSIEFNERIYVRSNTGKVYSTNEVLRNENKIQFPSYAELNGFAVGQSVNLFYTSANKTGQVLGAAILDIDYENLIVQFDQFFLPVISTNTFDNDQVLEISTASGEKRSDLYLGLNFAESFLSARTNFLASSNQNGYLQEVGAYRPSKIDGTQTLFYVDTSALSPGGSSGLVVDGKQSGQFQILSGVLAYDAETAGDKPIRTYTLTLEILNPACLFEDIDDWQNAGFYFDLEWYSLSGVKENPEVTQWFFNPAESGWFGEAFGDGGAGLNIPDSTFVQLVQNDIYFDSDTSHTVIVNSISSNIALAALYYPQNESNFDQYDNQSNLTMLLETFGPVSVGSYTSELYPSGGSYDIEVTSYSFLGNNHTIEFTFKPDANFTTLFEELGEDERRFRIVAIVGNVSLLLFDSTLKETPKPIELMSDYKPAPAANWGFYETDSPNKEYGAEGAIGNGGALVSIADNIRFKAFLALPKFKRYENLRFKVVAAEKTNPNNNFILEELDIDLSSALYNDTTGITELAFSKQKTSNFPQISGFDKAIIGRFSPYPDELNRFQVSILFPFILDWRYWIAQANAFAEFEPDRNRNYINYDTTTFGIFLKCEIEHDQALIEHFAPIDDIHDFNETFTDIPNNEEWGGFSLIEIRQLDGTQQPVLFTNELMRVKITVNTIQAIGINPGDFWGQLTIEPNENSPRYVLSSNYASGSTINNGLKPLSGEDRLLATRVNANQATFEALVDGNLLSTGDYKLRLKFMNISSPLEQVRTSFDVKVKIPPVRVLFQEGKIIRDCCQIFKVFADQDSLDTDKNNVTSAPFKLFGEGDDVEFKLYDSNGNLTSFQPTTQVFPNDSEAKYTSFSWKEVLSSEGFGCYQLRYVYTDAFANDTELVWADYKLIPWSFFNCRGLVSFIATFDGKHSIDGINYEGSFLQDTINVPGRFGLRQPKKGIDNIIINTGEQISVIRQNTPEYEFNSAPVQDFITDKLSNLFFLSEKKLFVTDYNRTNHKDYTLFPVIVSESDELEYNESTKASISCKFQDKTLNQRTI